MNRRGRVGPALGDRLSVLLLTVFVCWTLAPASAATGQEPTPAEQPASWEKLDQRPAHGEQCIVCRAQIHEGDIFELRYKGRTFFVAAAMLDDFEADPDHYFHAMQARGGLFDEAAVDVPPMRTGWLYFGSYVLIGLLFAAACSYLALDKGLPAWGWFFAGLLLNVLALAAIATRKRQPGAHLEGAPAGLAKIPITLAPATCAHCGNSNHPSASACSDCGHALIPTVEPETARG